MKLLPTLLRPRAETEVAEPAASVSLEPIRLIMRDADLAGWVRPDGLRVSDRLATGEPLWFLPATAVGDEWVPIDTSGVLLVMPPAHVSPPERRVRRQLHEVIVRADRFWVSGTAHLMPGEEYDPYLRSTRPFLPLTGATLVSPEEQRQVDVVIVNLKQADEFRVV